MDVIGQIKNCGKCSRRILVEQIMIGISHTAKVLVLCWDCLDEDRRAWAIEKYKLGEE